MSSVRWCFLGSHEIPAEDYGVMAGSSRICTPCAQTARGQKLIVPFETTVGYRPQLPGGMREPNWSRRKRAWLKRLHTS